MNHGHPILILMMSLVLLIQCSSEPCSDEIDLGKFDLLDTKCC